MKRVIRLWKYEFFLWEFLAIMFAFLAMEDIFNWLLMPVSVVILAYEKLMSIAIFGFVLYKFRHLTTMERVYVLLFTGVMVRLVGESLLTYGTPMQEFTMYTILFPVIFTIFIKGMCRSLKVDFLPFLAQFYLYLYIVFMVLYGRGFSFSLAEVTMDDYGPFSGDTRIIHARSIFMLIIPLLYYFNQFLQRNYKALVPFSIALVAILIHQHRSVWASTMLAMAVFLLASYRNKFVGAAKVFKVSFAVMLLLGLVWFTVSATSPKFIDLFQERSSEIFHPNREGGTGEFRAEQRLVYFQYVLQRPIFGWTFEGFEMPNPLVNWWPAKSGQHFHEGYMEMLFYEGIVGLLLKYSFLFYLAFKAFSKKLSRDSVVLVSFCLSGFIFSFSYVLPLIFWGVVGVTLYYLEKKPEEEAKDEGELLTIQDEALPEHQLLNEHQQGNYSLDY